MNVIITGANGTLAYWTADGSGPALRAFDRVGGFHRPGLLGFARLSAFAVNRNHAPSGHDGAVTRDAGIDLLFRIAGAR